MGRGDHLRSEPQPTQPPNAALRVDAEPARPVGSKVELIDHPRERSWLQAISVHPLVALGVVGLDAMLFGGELATTGLGTVLLAPVAGVAVFLATLLVQRRTCQDSWGEAAGKALILGVLTAVPTPLPAFVTAALGGAGLLTRRQGPR